MKVFMIDAYMVLKEMTSRLVNPHRTLAPTKESVSDLEEIEKGQEKITKILKQLINYPTHNLINLPVHERALIALNKVAKYVEAASHFDTERAIE